MGTPMSTQALHYISLQTFPTRSVANINYTDAWLQLLCTFSIRNAVVPVLE